MSADYLGEAHELGHLFGLGHGNPSSLMRFAGQQSNYLLDVDCETARASHLVKKLNH